ncbi:MAG: NUDIX hydrolase [Pseudomonadales bacterium]|nr:NUDIX hydrolase [Pseudomonadales bacterium]
MSSKHKAACPQQLGPWCKNTSEQVYQNPWIEVFHEQVTTPGGTPGIYGRVHFKGQAVGIVPIDDQGNTYLVKQYRYTLAEDAWEIPMGGCGRDDDTEQAALRELEEETGLRAKRLLKLGNYHTSNSVTDEQGCAYLALELTQTAQMLEASEADLIVHKLPFTEAIDWLDAGKITDCISVAALLQAERYLQKQQRYLQKQQ